jgi:hypothetical protein
MTLTSTINNVLIFFYLIQILNFSSSKKNRIVLVNLNVFE